MTAVSQGPSTTESHGLTSEFEHEPVPAAHRRRWLSVAAVWFGFPMILTNAVFGGVIVYGLGFVRGLLAILAGNLVLALYVGLLSHLAGSTGRNFALVAKSTFGNRGYAIASGFLSTIVIGWFAFQTGLTGSTLHSTLGWNEPSTILLAGVLYIAVTFIGIRALAILGAVAAPLFLVLAAVAIWFVASSHGLGQVLGYAGQPGAVVASIGAAVTMTVAGFADSGTMTADFTRWATDGRSAVGASLTAFPVANFVSMAVGGLIVAAGAATDAATDGGDFLGILVGHGWLLTAIAVAFVFINLGSVCTHCLYNGAVGWSHITASKMRLLTIVLGVIGVIAAVAGVWTLFADWLNILGVFVPPIGAVLITDQLLLRRQAAHRAATTFRPTAFAAWAVGAVVAGVVHFTAPAYAEAVAGILAAGLAYLAITRLTAGPPAPATRPPAASASASARTGRGHRGRRSVSGTTDDEVCRMPATELVARIGRRELSPLEVTDAVLARMDRLDPVLHAFCTPTPELARQQAARVGEKIARGEPVGPLAGVPVGVKDLIATKGIRTAMGSPAYRDFVPDEDDVAVERILAADAVILGKTNVPELGYSGVGHSPISATTRNPWNPEMTSGGSSAGSGAAVASGIGPVALGSDGGGSVRIPAAHCGIYGFKGSMGRIPLYPGCRDERYPGISSWESLEHLGPMTRTVADTALMMSVLAGPDPRDRHSLPAGDVDWLGSVRDTGLAGLRVAFSPDLGYLAVDPEVREIAARAATVFEKDLGCVVEEGHPGWENPFEAFWSLVVADTDLAGMRAMVDRYGSEMSPHLVDMVRGPWTAEQLTTAGMTRKAVVNRMWRFMADYDLFLTPTLAVPPFPVHMQGPEIIDGRFVPTTSWLGFTYPINMTGQPAATVPAGFTSAGLPVGLQIIGRHLADGAVLRASAAFEAAAPWAHRWPALA